MSWLLFCFAWACNGWRVMPGKEALSSLFTTYTPTQSGVRPIANSPARQRLELLRGGSLSQSASAALKKYGEEPVVVLASCGAGLPAVTAVNEALGAPSNPISMVTQTPLPIALFNVAGKSESDISIALAAADVIALQVRFNDLVQQTPHGLSQLRSLLRRSPASSLMLVVSDYDDSEASEADVRAFVKKELRDYHELNDKSVKWQCFLLPSTNAVGYEAGLSKFREALLNQARVSNEFAEHPKKIQEVIQEVAQTSEESTPLSAAPAKVYAAFKCRLWAEEALDVFKDGATALKADAGSLVDLGDQATSIMELALDTFDAHAAQSKLPVVVDTRKALIDEMHRLLYDSFKVQLSALQQDLHAKFVTKLESTGPSAGLEKKLAAEIKEVMKEFDMSAGQLSPPDAPWSFSYERAKLLDTIKKEAQEHIESFQVQGYYVSAKKRRIPVDFALHWLSLNPFRRTKIRSILSPS